MADVGSSPNRGGMLDQAPPQPPGGQKRSLMDTQQGAGSGGGLGADAANPQIVALQGVAMIEQGTQLLSSAIPQLAPALTGFVTQLKQVVPQAMADQISGVDSTGAGAAPPGPGGAPGGMPPGPPPQGGVPAGAPVSA